MDEKLVGEDLIYQKLSLVTPNWLNKTPNRLTKSPIYNIVTGLLFLGVTLLSSCLTCKHATRFAPAFGEH